MSQFSQILRRKINLSNWLNWQIALRLKVKYKAKIFDLLITFVKYLQPKTELFFIYHYSLASANSYLIMLRQILKIKEKLAKN